MPTGITEELVEDPSNLAFDTPLISLNVLTDESEPKTMQIQGVVGKK